MTGSFMQLLTPLGGFIQNHKINPQKTLIPVHFYVIMELAF